MNTVTKAALFAAAMIATPALAQNAGVVTVDLNRVYSESAAAKSAQAQIKTKYETNLRNAANTFNSAATAYNTQVEAARKVAKPDTALPAATQTALQNAENTLRQADSNLSNMQNEVNAVGQYVQQQILEKTLPIAEQVRAEKKAAIVAPRGSVLAADPAADVTATVIQRLDAQLKTVSITLPQQNNNAAAAAPAAQRPAAPATGR